MIKVATEYHHTSSDLNELPAYKCMGTCKKVFWKSEFAPAPFGVLLHCEKCGGQLRSAKEVTVQRDGIDYLNETIVP